MPETRMDNKWWISFIVQIIVYVVAIMIAYGALDKRVTVLETVQQQKVDGEDLQKQLKVWKDEIVLEVKDALRETRLNQKQ